MVLGKIQFWIASWQPLLRVQRGVGKAQLHKVVGLTPADVQISILLQRMSHRVSLVLSFLTVTRGHFTLRGLVRFPFLSCVPMCHSEADPVPHDCTVRSVRETVGSPEGFRGWIPRESGIGPVLPNILEPSYWNVLHCLERITLHCIDFQTISQSPPSSDVTQPPARNTTTR